MSMNRFFQALEREAGVVVLLLIATLFGARPLLAQPALSLRDAIARAKAHNPEVGSAAAAEKEAAEHVKQARGSYYPKVDLAESWQRGNNPVFVFSSLLAQRQFTESGFALDALNHPSAIDDFRTGLSVELPLFDPTIAANVRSASVGLDMAGTRRQLVDQDLTLAVTDAFGRVLIATAMVQSAAAAVERARADRELASNRRVAGRVTDADVLQLDVYVASALEQQVQAISDERIARARLNQLMGEPLTELFSLEPATPSVAIDVSNPAALEAEALNNRPEVALAKQMEQVAAAAVDAAHATFLPHVSAQGGWEANGGSWNSRASSWGVGVVARVNLFHGFADQAQLGAARAQAARRASERTNAETMVRFEVQTAIARLEAARASEVVGRAAADSARESRQIVRNRYESGLADAAMLLRAADAVQHAEAQQIAALVNVLTATATLQRAVGRR